MYKDYLDAKHEAILSLEAKYVSTVIIYRVRKSFYFRWTSSKNPRYFEKMLPPDAVIIEIGRQHETDRYIVWEEQ